MTSVYLACLLGGCSSEERQRVFSRVVSVHCPVDVEVYGPDGELCGRTEGGVAYNTENSAVCVAVAGDEKFVYIPDDGEYTIKYIGTDSGTMKLEDQVYNIETGDVVSESTFENVALEKGKAFESVADGSAEEVKSDLFVLGDDSEPLAVVQSDGSEAVLMSKATVTLSQTSYPYDGSAKEPEVTVEVEGETIDASCYTVTYDNNVNVGTATATVTGTGGLQGTRTLSFDVVKGESSVKLAAQTRTYTGKPLAYTGKMTRSGSSGVVSYSYYSDAKCKKAIKAANVKAAGTYYVKATLAADENYEAAESNVVKLVIAPAANPMDVAAKTAKVNYSKKAQTVKAAAAYNFKEKAVGKVTYARVAKGSSAWLPKVNVKVKAAGNANHKAASKQVTVKVKVK